MAIKQKERKMEEAVEGLWRVIDEARDMLVNPSATPEKKRTWAKILGDTVSILNKIQQARKGEKIEEDDLATLLEKVPERYLKIVRNIFKKNQKVATSPPSSDKSDASDIYEQARALKYGDPILITWIDASRSKNADATKLPLPNHAVETLKEGIGRFVTVQEGDAYHDPHLVYWTDNLCGISYTIESVPLAVVKKIVKISKEP